MKLRRRAIDSRVVLPYNLAAEPVQRIDRSAARADDHLVSDDRRRDEHSTGSIELPQGHPLFLGCEEPGRIDKKSEDRASVFDHDSETNQQMTRFRVTR